MSRSRICSSRVARILLAGSLLLLLPAVVNAATLLGAYEAPAGESGVVDGQNQGVSALHWASARTDYLSAGDACSRNISSAHFAMNEYTWVLSCPYGELWTVHTHYFAEANLVGIATVDDFFDCDFASSRSILSIRNDDGPGVKTWVSESLYGECSDPYPDFNDDAKKTVTSTYAATTCVADGTMFSCTVRVDAQAYIKSEAVASASAQHWIPGMTKYLVRCD